MGQRIISADSHVIMRNADILERLPSRHHEPYRRGKLAALRRFVGDEAERMMDADQLGLDKNAERRWEAAGRRGAFDPYDRLKDMDADGVDAEVLYTDDWAGAAFYEMPDGAWLEGFRAFNSAAIEFASVNPDRLVPVYIIPVVDIEAAVKEVQRVANEGARAVHIPLYPTDLGLAGYWDERYDPLWSVLQEAEIPVSQHVASNANLARMRREDPTPGRGVMHSIPPLFMAESLAFWMCAGVLERFPRLHVVFVETGLGWIPYLLDRLDRSQRKFKWDDSLIKEKPSYYFHRQVAVTFEEDEFGIANRDRIGVENLMWATDYPHPDSTWPHSREVIRTHFAGIPERETALMVGGNAARLYHL